MSVGKDQKGKELRNQLCWKYQHYNKVQFSQANAENKVAHLLKAHGVSKDRNQTPVNPIDKYIKPKGSQDPSLSVIGRQGKAYMSLTIVVLKKPLLDTLIALLVIYQLAFTLATNHLFIVFLKTLFPTVEQLLPKSSNTIRKYILLAFGRRKSILKAALTHSQSQIHFSFDL